MNRESVVINKKTSVAITGKNDEIDLKGPIWAINWFDLKRPKLYTIYNLLVFSHLKKVGGQAHFKGYIKEKLEGTQELDRQMLLIVKYPNAKAFLNMVSNKIFLLKSVLRLKSVRRFIFGFTKRIGDHPSPPQKPVRYIGKNYYLTHLFQGEGVSEDQIKELTTLFSHHNIVNYFSGLKAATISRIGKDGSEQVQPFFVDGLLLLEAQEQESFELLLNDPIYQAFKNKCTSNNIYQVTRII